MATILVVDDRPSNRDFLLTLLGYLGHRLLEAGDGAQALELIRSARPDLVITDILMPTMDGYEMVSRLRADPQLAATPVIFYTATYKRGAGDEAGPRPAGFETVLPKPSDPDRILAAVERAAAPRRAAGGDSTQSRARRSKQSTPARPAAPWTRRCWTCRASGPNSTRSRNAAGAAPVGPGPRDEPVEGVLRQRVAPAARHVADVRADRGRLRDEPRARS